MNTITEWLFVDAGIRAEAVIQGQNAHSPLAVIVRAMLPRILKKGVASETDIDIETLEQRLTAERAAANSVYVSDMALGVWARKPQFPEKNPNPAPDA